MYKIKPSSNLRRLMGTTEKSLEFLFVKKGKQTNRNIIYCIMTDSI